jgi:hypothetical protein
VARIPTVEVNLQVLELVFQDFDLWSKIRDGRLTSKPVYRAPAKTVPYGTSSIIKHFLPNGKHVATTHCIEAANGQVVHWDAKDFRFRGVCLWRA